VLVPVPAMAPGLSIQLPVGKPFNSTLPVETEQVGCVIVPTIGADGVDGCMLITTLADTGEVHPAELVTVKVFDPAVSPAIVKLVPVPAIDPGFTTQFPAGNPFKTTLPVETEQVGCDTVPIIGAEGVIG